MLDVKKKLRNLRKKVVMETETENFLTQEIIFPKKLRFQACLSVIVNMMYQLSWAMGAQY